MPKYPSRVILYNIGGGKEAKILIGLDYLAAGYLHLASSDFKCQLKKTPEITVTAADTTVRYDHSRSQAQLDAMEHDTVSPYAGNVQTHVGGLMAGEVSIAQNVRIMQETYPRFNFGCLYFDTVRVTITIKPTIYIAKEYKKDGCMYRAIREHERKHIAVDQQIVAKYKPRITDAVYGAVRELGAAHGPMKISTITAAQDRLQTHVQGVVRAFSGEMSAERRARQQEVDTLDEYERVQDKCRGRD